MPDALGSLRALSTKILQGRLSVLTGKVGSGKSTLAASLLSFIEKEFPNVAVGGILCRSVFEANTKVGYELEQLPSGERCLLALRSTLAENHGADAKRARLPLLPQGGHLKDVQEGNYVRIGQWFILQGALDKAERAIVSAVRGNCELVVIDEFGPLELEGKGLRSAADALACSGKAGILVVRESLLEEIRQLYGAFISTVVPISQVGPSLSSGFGGSERPG